MLGEAFAERGRRPRFATTAGLLSYGMGVNAEVVTTARPGVSRPGWIEVSLPPSGDAGAASVEIRFPPYDESGHEVATTQGADFAADVQAWPQGP